MKIIDLIKMETESLLNVMKLLSSQQIHTSEIIVNTETIKKAEETSNKKKNK